MKNALTILQQVQCGDVRVYYTTSLNGGGSTVMDRFCKAVRKLGRFSRALEMCSGPGFIGYALLSSGLCETLTFSDINRKAIAVAKITAREAGLLDRVTFYVSDCWDSIPESEVWDLVVVNPPYFNFNRKPVTQTDYFLPDGYVPLVWLDRDWRMHRKFYEGVGRHLTSGGKIVISECPEAGTLDEDWGEMIAKAGLRVIDTFLDAEYPTSFYYLILEKE